MSCAGTMVYPSSPRRVACIFTPPRSLSFKLPSSLITRQCGATFLALFSSFLRQSQQDTGSEISGVSGQVYSVQKSFASFSMIWPTVTSFPLSILRSSLSISMGFGMSVFPFEESTIFGLMFLILLAVSRASPKAHLWHLLEFSRVMQDKT